jgi:hypothetical protein
MLGTQARNMSTPKIPKPEDFFGFRMGDDGKLARWDKIVQYFSILATKSNRIRVSELGKSTEGNPFLLVVISSPQNLRSLERFRKTSQRLADPRGLSAEEARRMVREGKAVVLQSMSLHASEVGGTQMSVELAYDLLTSDSPQTRMILDNVVFLVVPCFNPDGQIMIADWYEKYKGTKYEGGAMPWLYHKYVGHDNNRDAFALNQVESQYMAKILFREWIPQAYIDHHHMGSYDARFNIPPYSEPIHPNPDPIIWRELSWYGAHMALKLEEAGKKGVVNNATFPGWGHLGFHWITNHHNIAGMVTESASAKIATPKWIDPSQLRGDGSGDLPSYNPQTNFPSPWPGGWWRLRDIVEQQKVAALALLEMAALHKDTALWNMYQKARRAIEKGEREPPYAFIIPADQHDPLTAFKLLQKLRLQGVEVKRAVKEFKAGREIHSLGTFVVFTQQPKRAVAMSLLARTIYPDNEWTRDRFGKPRGLRPLDTATDTYAEFMGVNVIPVDSRFSGEFETVEEARPLPGQVMGRSATGYVLDCRINASYTGVVRLLKRRFRVSRAEGEVEVGGSKFPPGTFIIHAQKNLETELRALSKTLHLTFWPITKKLNVKMRDLKPPRIGVYQRYWGGNIDEGWTRWLLEQHGFPYKTIMDREIKAGNLNRKYDIIILPQDAKPLITGIELEKFFKEKTRWPGFMPDFPPEYRSGIEKKGIESLRSFVEAGGTLVTFDTACDLPIDEFKLQVRNAASSLDRGEFYCPGSTLWVEFDVTKPMAYGMPERALIFFWNSPILQILTGEHDEDYAAIGKYPETNVLQSGWLVGEQHLRRKPPAIEVKYGKGRIALIGFRPQHRAQTDGTYKILFNCLLN